MDTHTASIADRSRRQPTAVTTLKHYARILHRRVREGEPDAILSMRRLREFKELSVAQLIDSTQRRHCLTVSALQVGCQSWPHALAVLAGETGDFGTLLYPSSCYGHWNIWSAHYDEAVSIRAAHGGYLLAYRRQFLIVDRHYVDSLGLDPDDPDWAAIGRDWVKPSDGTARARLYEKLVQNALVGAVLRQSRSA
jgi:hypothetical protein